MKEQVIKFTDKSLKCEGCGKPFKFEAGEQAYYYRQGLALPRHCPSCRFLRRLEEVRNGQ